VQSLDASPDDGDRYMSGLLAAKVFHSRGAALLAAMPARILLLAPITPDDGRTEDDDGLGKTAIDADHQPVDPQSRASRLRRATRVPAPAGACPQKRGVCTRVYTTTPKKAEFGVCARSPRSA